jgi:N-acetylmuramoyl-L-alanine amidase
MTLDIDVRPSPHKNSRRGAVVDGVVIHYTATENANQAIRWFEHDDAKVSAHFVIDVDGAITSCVGLSDRAWHAGKAEMPGTDGEVRGDPNTWTIGIELANPGKLVERNGETYRKAGRDLKPWDGDSVRAVLHFDDGKRVAGLWAVYPPEQINALNDLLDMIAEDFGDDVAANVMGHDEIAQPLGRKIDPGPAFPWSMIVRRTAGRRCWPSAVGEEPAREEPKHTEATTDAAKDLDEGDADG